MVSDDEVAAACDWLRLDPVRGGAFADEYERWMKGSGDSPPDEETQRQWMVTWVAERKRRRERGKPLTHRMIAKWAAKKEAKAATPK